MVTIDEKNGELVAEGLVRLDHLDTFVWTSVRYAIGRSTGVVKMVCDAVRSVARHLQQGTLDLIVRDIRLERKRQGRLGNACDDREWAALEAWIVERRKR